MTSCKQLGSTLQRTLYDIPTAEDGCRQSIVSRPPARLKYVLMWCSKRKHVLKGKRFQWPSPQAGLQRFSAAVAYFSSGGIGRTFRHLADRRFCRAARDSFIRLTVTLTTSHVTFACSFHWLFARGVAVSRREDEWSHVAMLEGAGSVIPCLTSLLEGTGREVLGHVSRRCCNVGRDREGKR